MKMKSVFWPMIMLLASCSFVAAQTAAATGESTPGAAVSTAESSPKTAGERSEPANSNAATAPVPPEAPSAPPPPPPAAPSLPPPPSSSASSTKLASPPAPAVNAARALPSAAAPRRPASSQLPSDDALLSGIFEEEGNLNVEEAMNSYQAAIDRFDSQRAAAANAVFRLGECYRKLGKAEEAKTQYARILREFPDQVELARLSQKLLFAEPPRATGNRGAFQQRLQSIVRRAEANIRDEADQQGQMAYSDAPRPGAVSPREMQLLAEEIKLVQEQIKEAQMKLQSGVGSSTEVFTLKRELLELQRKLAAIEDASASRLQAVPSPYDVPAHTPRSSRDATAGSNLAGPTPVPPPTSAPGTSGDVRETIPGAPSSVQFQPSAPAARAGRAEPGAAPAPRTLPTRVFRGPLSAQEERKAQLEADLARVREQLFNAETQVELGLEILAIVKTGRPETLPDQAGADPRYQKLKQEYEDALLRNAADTERENMIKEALRRIETWVKSIYLPELQAKDSFAQTQRDRYRQQAADLRARLKKLQEEEDKAQAETARQDSETREPLKPALPTPPAPPAPAAPPAKF